MYALNRKGFWFHGYSNKTKNPAHIASWWFYCSTQMAFLKMNFNGQARKNVLLYLCNWSLWNSIGKIHRIIGHILYLVNHQARAINIAAFGNLDLYPASAKNVGNCLGLQMICNTGYLKHSLCKVFPSLPIAYSEAIFGFVAQALDRFRDTLHLLRLTWWWQTTRGT